VKCCVSAVLLLDTDDVADRNVLSTFIVENVLFIFPAVKSNVCIQLLLNCFFKSILYYYLLRISVACSFPCEHSIN